MRSKSSARTSLLPATSLAVFKTFSMRPISSMMIIGYLLRERRRFPQRWHLQAKIPKKIYIRRSFKYCSEAYKTGAPGDCGRKRAKDIHSWVQPLGQSVITTVSFVEFTNLVL